MEFLPFLLPALLIVPALGYLLILLVFKILKRMLNASSYEKTRRSFFVLGSIFFISAAVHRLYYFHDEMIYAGKRNLNPAYANQIEVETYLMSEPNLINLFQGEPPNPDKRDINSQKVFWSGGRFPGPLDPRFYLVIRVKNNGDQTAWGVLNYTYEDQFVRHIDVPPLPAKMCDFKNIVLLAQPKDSFGAPTFSLKNDKISPYPQLKSTWLRIYTKKERAR
ncbi:MAG: hypothetical protein K1X28_05130 [Parachlamydiales bacterium]|nr:hypothetical protein [Parachlamydiales bacterium]